ncbi:FAD-binding oxidoreductase [Rhizobium sp. LCM 4573]|uniref:NAD(P)/FAD-dependent oxidoreductase n=1 Tax=Rhizobium sp. LCM 4573 TaxID=1848291 RepID=UPI0008D90001|nr:FAD-binding oxidoreductase [Rhizobium sp. LCM 4573]OHV84446.1 D-amino-acid oxidase [Rhizobium sp. LCM 4573]
MAHADNPAGSAGQSGYLQRSADLVIIGGGIMGLWAAVKAERLGIDTLLVDAGRPGQGASGGLLGALMPHMPDKWNEKKQFQFDALFSLEDEIAKIEAATGIACGYRRSGRLIPLPKPHLREIALGHSADAEVHWRRGDRRFFWHVLDRSPDPSWVDPAFAEAGLVDDTLAARVSPRGLISALVGFLKRAQHVRLAQGLAVERIDAAANRVLFRDGESLAFGSCMVAAGHRSFPLIEALGPPLPRRVGQPVKGQAALLKADIDPSLPVVFLGGLYIVPHEGGLVAVGSTSEDVFESETGTDARLDELLGRARALSPALRDAPVVERWAGLRPKAIGRDPMVGPHPDHPQVIALTGGFKVSFGLAHRLADAALCAVEGRDTRLPPSFSLENHLAAASR